MYSASASSHQSPVDHDYIVTHLLTCRQVEAPPGPSPDQCGGGTEIKRGCEFGCELMETMSLGATALETNRAIRLVSSPVPRSVADSKSVQCAFESHRGTYSIIIRCRGSRVREQAVASVQADGSDALRCDIRARACHSRCPTYGLRPAGY
jgi:hypothetical protein